MCVAEGEVTHVRDLSALVPVVQAIKASIRSMMGGPLELNELAAHTTRSSMFPTRR
jgi:hypothetical protein